MYIKNLKKKYQEKWENAYLIVKNARASRALRAGPGPQPILACFTCSTPLPYVGKFSENISGPPPLDQMLDPLVLLPYYGFWKEYIIVTFFNRWTMNTSTITEYFGNMKGLHAGSGAEDIG